MSCLCEQSELFQIGSSAESNVISTGDEIVIENEIQYSGSLRVMLFTLVFSIKLVQINLSQTSPLIDLVDFNEVHWSQLPKQLGTWFGVFIVEFLYGLDIAAIELDMGISLVFNHELKAVNWSNVVSDRLGGYTGSYILL
ncbi:hypothetical protein JG688_00013694 [Phytophthora aleatoria]|uniref:Uncharacterized protein n=1 Tax=Phytophthora aleatoria TaxID=2496075 RepID=A0A8J5M0Z7_9STRA|nr:hypothetical protein JG688_00013694 [Phytophthora aleatoria]